LVEQVLECTLQPDALVVAAEVFGLDILEKQLNGLVLDACKLGLGLLHHRMAAVYEVDRAEVLVEHVLGDTAVA
jgi:hypothetical protein